MLLSKKQLEVIGYWNANQPILLVNEGAVRSGKTWVDNLIFLRHVAGFRNRGVDFILTGHTVSSLVRNVLQPLEQMFGLSCRLNTHNQFDLFGNRINVFGGDKIDSYKPMTGMTSYGWYGNEVSLQHENTIQEAFQRCSGEGFRIIWDTNPDYPDHPIKLQHIDRSGERMSDGRERVHSFHWELTDNPFLTREYVENLKATTPPGMWYNRAIKGMWVGAEGMVYEGWNPECHVIEPFRIPDDWTRVGAIDLGFDNPFVHLWGALDGDKRLYIYDEHYEARRLLSHHADVIKARDKCAWRVRDHDAQEGEELKSYHVFTRPAQKDVLRGIQKVAERLVRQPDGKPRLFVFKTCANVIREFPRYCWKGGKAKEEPVKENDHALDALRYMVMELDNRRVYVYG